jgi:hypothetical protein
MSEISSDVSSRICTHMNEDHAVSVYAMAKRLIDNTSNSLPNCVGSDLTNAKLMQVTLCGCEIRAIVCRGDACHLHNLHYPFVPPLSSASEVRKRMVDIHQYVCSPTLGRWFFTKPVVPLIIGALALLGYSTIGLGYHGTIATLETSFPQLNFIIVKVFGTTAFFANLIHFAFGLALLAHGCEALYAAHRCRFALKLSWSITSQWFLTVLATGYPSLVELRRLLTVDYDSRQKRNLNKQQ